MDPSRVAEGLAVSSLGGALVLWLLIDKLAWGYLERQGIERKQKILTIPLGIVERILYSMAFILGAPGWVGVWLAIKVAVQWDRWKGENRGTYNVFLMGSALSILIAFLGAWIALGEIPTVTSP